ncbi:hypothetical protein JCM10212_005866 [Sporobolomyces blumeae]
MLWQRVLPRIALTWRAPTLSPVRSSSSSRPSLDSSAPLAPRSTSPALLTAREDSLPRKGKGKTQPKYREKKPLPELDENDLVEHFVRGSGPGGQATNKTSNACQLLHVPTGLRVTCHETRSRETNRRIARRTLQEKLDQLLSPPGQSRRDQLIERERKKKEAKRRKARRKQAGGTKDDEDKDERGSARADEEIVDDEPKT